MKKRGMAAISKVMFWVLSLLFLIAVLTAVIPGMGTLLFGFLFTGDCQSPAFYQKSVDDILQARPVDMLNDVEYKELKALFDKFKKCYKERELDVPGLKEGIEERESTEAAKDLVRQIDALEKAENWLELLNMLEKFVNNFPDHPNVSAYQIKIDALKNFVEGETALKRSQYDEAIEKLRKINSQNSFYKKARILLGEAYKGKGDFVNAQNLYVNLIPELSATEKEEAIEFYKNVESDVLEKSEIESITLNEARQNIFGNTWVYRIKYKNVIRDYDYGVSEEGSQKQIKLLIERVKDGQSEGLPWFYNGTRDIIDNQIISDVKEFCSQIECKEIDHQVYGKIQWPLPPKPEIEQLRDLEINSIKRFENTTDRTFDIKYYEIEYPSDTYFGGKVYLFHHFYNKFSYDYNLQLYRLSYSNYQSLTEAGRGMQKISDRTDLIEEIKKDLKTYAEKLQGEAKYTEAGEIYNAYFIVDLGFGKNTFDIAQKFKSLALNTTETDARNKYYTWSLRYYVRYVDEMNKAFQLSDDQKNKRTQAKQEIESICNSFTLSFCQGIPQDIYYP
ncbi:tetratricopeptide repeat protein [Nanoarchaeota archaeon]